MDFAFTDEQLELKNQARGWLAQRYPLDRDWDGPQDDRWNDLSELGWLDVAEAGLGFVEEAMLLEEMGYALYPGPYLAHVAGQTEANQRLTKLALEILGGPDLDEYWTYQQLRSRGNTIEAGTSEILRNIVAERVLGLPRSR